MEVLTHVPVAQHTLSALHQSIPVAVHASRIIGIVPRIRYHRPLFHLFRYLPSSSSSSLLFSSFSPLILFNSSQSPSSLLSLLNLTSSSIFVTNPRWYRGLIRALPPIASLPGIPDHWVSSYRQSQSQGAFVSTLVSWRIAQSACPSSRPRSTQSLSPTHHLIHAHCPSPGVSHLRRPPGTRIISIRARILVDGWDQLHQPTMTDYRLPLHQPPPARKPVPNMRSGYAPYQAYDAPQQQLSPHPSVASLAHSRSRTSSSHVLPHAAHQQPPYATGPSPQHTMTAPIGYPPSRRLSSATTSTSSTGNAGGPMPAAGDIRRSTSSRSAQSQLGYVALMRRQKATVWCDRAQPEDPRLRAQKMADKKRAYLEVHGAGTGGRAGTLASGKIKHSKGGTDFSPSTLVGATVPVRLSANEVGDADEDARSDTGFPYRRTGSGRSSLGSGSRYPSGYQRTPQGTMGSGSTPPNEKSDLPEVSEHPPAEREAHAPHGEDAARRHSFGSDQEESFGMVGEMAAPSAATTAAEKAKRADELRRSGSVDERTTTMTNVRLFVANPDLSD